MKVRLGFIAVLVAFSAARSLAQPGVLSAVDDLAAGGNCEAALALLEHAQGSPAEIAGRRALCEARLGRRGEAAAHVASALGAPADPWVVAHRAELLAALSSVPASPASVSPTAVPTTDAPAASTAPPASTPAPRAEEHIPSAFIEELGHDVPEDRPLPRTRATIQGSRFLVRASAGAGMSMHFGHGFDTLSDYRTLPSQAGLEATATIAAVSGSNFGWKTAFPFLFGGQVEYRLANRLSVVADGAVRIEAVSADSTYEAMVVRNFGFESALFGSDGSFGTLHVGPRWGLDASASLRVPIAASRLFVGFGGHVSGTRQRASGKLYDPGPGFSPSYFSWYGDGDNRAPRTYEGRITRVAANLVAGGLFDLGGYLGPHRNVTVTMRIVAGASYADVHLLVGIPIWSSAP